MYCRNCGKELMEGARFCMYCGTPVEAVPSEVTEEPVPAPEAAPEAEAGEKPAAEPLEGFFSDAREEAEPEEPVRREKPVFDEINWNVDEYPDSDTVTKTDDIDFNWNARPEDIPDPVSRRYQDEPDHVTDFFKASAASEPEQEIIQPVDDIDIKLDSVIRGEEEPKAPEVFGDKPEAEQLSAAQRIDKFYTFNRKNEEFQQLLNREYEKVRSGNAIGEELSRADAIADERFEARDAREPQTMDELFEAEGIEKPYQPKAFESDVLQRIEAQEAERELKRREEEARKAEIEKARKKAEEARLRAEREAEEARLKEEQDAIKAAEEARAIAEREAKEAQEAAQEAKLRAEKEARARAEEAARREEAEAKIRAEEEARRVAEEEARIKAEAVARYQAQEEARIRAEEDLKAAQEAAKIKAQQEARIAAEEQARLEAAKEARRLEEEEARRRLEEEQERIAREANESIAAEEARKVLEQTARMRDEEAAKIRAAVAGLRASTRAGAADPRREVAEAHRATRDQINEMARARDTFFGDIDVTMEKDVSGVPQEEPAAVPQEPVPAPEQTVPRDTIEVPQVEAEPPHIEVEEPKDVLEPPASRVTGRNTMLGGNMADTRVFDKEEILAGVPQETIAASREAFAGMGAAKAADFKKEEESASGYSSIDDLLNELETINTENKDAVAPGSDFGLEDVFAAPEPETAPAFDDKLDRTMIIPQGDIEEPFAPEEDFTEPAAPSPFIPQEAAPEAEPEPTAEEPLSDFAELEQIPQEPQVMAMPEEPTMVYTERAEEAPAPAEDLSGTRRFDEGMQAAADPDSTIVVGQMPQTFADLPSNDFDDYGNAEAQEFIRKQEEESAFNTVAQPEQPAEDNAEAKKAAAAAGAGAAAAGVVALSKKEKKAADKAAKREAKEAARAAKKAKKGAGKAAGAAEEAEDAAEQKGGKGRTILIILLVLLCLVLAAEIVGIGVHYVAPQSRVAEIVDNQLNKVIHLITGEEENDYTVFAEERREVPRDDYAEVIAEKADKNYNGLIGTVAYDPELVYNDEQVADISDLVLSMPITEFEWGRTEENASVYYDEEVIGQAIAYESQKYALLKDGDESVLSMISKESTKKTLAEKKNSNPGPFTKLDIGEVRVSGSYYYVWVREQIGDETKERVIKMFPEKQFDMMVERGYDI